MTLITVVFWIFAVLALGSAVLCISRASPVASALWLVVTMFSLAVLFVILDAQFIAVMQILVYAGAVMVLFLFVIMLLNLGRGAGQDRKGVVGLTVGVVLAGAVFGQLWFLRHAAPPALIQVPNVMAQLQQQHGMVGSVAGPLYDAYLVPFEITSACSSSRPSWARWCSRNGSSADAPRTPPSPSRRRSSRDRGRAGVLTRRNAIIIFMCVELMLNAVNLTFIAFAQTLRGRRPDLRLFRDGRGRRGSRRGPRHRPRDLPSQGHGRSAEPQHSEGLGGFASRCNWSGWSRSSPCWASC